MLQADWAADLLDSLGRLTLAMAGALLLSAQTWLVYVALEPTVRRHRPDLLVGWSRMLEGRLRDPLVTRDLLGGALLGLLWVVCLQCDTLIVAGLGLTPFPSLRSDELLAPCLGWRDSLAGLGLALWNGLSQTLSIVLLVVALHVLVGGRRRVLALSTLALLPSVLPLGAHPAVSLVLLGGGIVVTGIVVLGRAGPLLLATAIAVAGLLHRTPLSFDPQAWYAPAPGPPLALLGVILLTALWPSSGAAAADLANPPSRPVPPAAAGE